MALRRAAHQLVDAPPLVFPDAFAVPIVGPDAAEALRRTPAAERRPYSAAMRAWVVARARFAEDTLAVMVQNNSPCQYVVLGAGLDTFALRNPYPHTTVFEVDHPATQSWKRDRLAAVGLHLPSSAHLVSIDFETQSLEHQLLESGFDLAIPTVAAWLGVVPYLSQAGFSRTCSFLGRLRPGSRLVFDYIQPREVLPAVEQLMHDSLASRVAQAGEPFQSFFTPERLPAVLHAHELGVLEDLDSRDLTARYFAHRTDRLRPRGAAGRLCHATVA